MNLTTRPQLNASEWKGAGNSRQTAFIFFSAHDLKKEMLLIFLIFVKYFLQNVTNLLFLGL